MDDENYSNEFDWQPKAVFASVSPALDCVDRMVATTGVAHKMVHTGAASFSVVETEAWDQHLKDLRAIAGEVDDLPVPPTGLNESRIINRKRFLYIGYGRRVATQAVPMDEGDPGVENDPDS